ncbi:MAG: hypothetical protein DWI02_00390 [Planctomycetota bacterium]|nr:MAG: hypothetical protein DWI02_00390 [Planctomycetota bacterium]
MKTVRVAQQLTLLYKLRSKISRHCRFWSQFDQVRQIVFPSSSRLDETKATMVDGKSEKNLLK